MKPQGKAILAAGILIIGAFACFKDPVESKQGDPNRVSLSSRFLQQNVGDVDNLTVQVLDEQGNPLAMTDLTFGVVAGSDPTVATVALFPDSTQRTWPGGVLTKIIVTATAPGTTRLTVTANGVTDTLTIIAYPLVFNGTITPTTVKEGDTIVVNSTAALTFSPTATATIGGVSAFVRSVSATKLVLFATRPGTAQQVSISGTLLLGTIAVGALPATTTLTTTAAASEPANDALGGGPVIPLPTVVGAYTEVVGTVNGAGAAFASPGPDVDDFYTITTTTADSLEFQFSWQAGTPTDVDIDGLVLTTAGGCAKTCAAAGSNNPEIERDRLAAATTYRVGAELWDIHGNTGPRVYRIRIYKRG